MQEYLENNLDRILANHFRLIERKCIYEQLGLSELSEMIDDISFYKEWSKDTKYKANIFLTEVEDCEDEEPGEDEKEGEEI